MQIFKTVAGARKCIKERQACELVVGGQSNKEQNFSLEVLGLIHLQNLLPVSPGVTLLRKNPKFVFVNFKDLLKYEIPQSFRTFFLFEVLAIETRALHMLGEHFTTELHAPEQLFMKQTLQHQSQHISQYFHMLSMKPCFYVIYQAML